MRYLFIFVVCLMLSSVTFGQTAVVKFEPVTPHSLETLGLTTDGVSAGIPIVGVETFVYMSPMEATGEDVTSFTFTLSSQPGGSTAALTSVLTDWVYLQPDVAGEYEVNLSITTATGTHDTTVSIFAGEYVGVGGFEGIGPSYPQCYTCHSGTPAFDDIFARWEVSGHANIFNYEIEYGAAYYSTSCMKCHTTGYDHNVAADNGGFDDVALALGWDWANYSPPAVGNWQTIIDTFPDLVNLATIGCENCHGAGSQHAATTGTERISVDYGSGVCAQCHDEPWRHNRYAQWENSTHSHAMWYGGFARTNNGNGLGDCIRCHDGLGYIEFTKGNVLQTEDWVLADHTTVTCQTCHDPHSNDQEYDLRVTPAGSDTLGNGWSYTGMGGKGGTCMDCHKARRDVVSYTAGGVTSSHWGPHHSVQADVFFGQNAAEWDGVGYMSTAHMYANDDACVDCHMYATTDTGTVTRDRVGQHSFKLYDADNDYYHTAACESCHGPKGSWDDFMAPLDYDADGTVEGYPGEIAGLEMLLRYYLPPVNVDSISWQDIQAANDLDLTKAYWNYQLIAYDGSMGMHNAKFSVDVLMKSIVAIGGVVPVEMVSFSATVSANTVNLAWQTATEANNLGFAIERKTDADWVTVGFVDGRGTTMETNDYTYADDLAGQNINGTISYRLKQTDYDGNFSYSKEIEVDFNSAPTEYVLNQNYPNPFNPSTKITYGIPFDSNVKIQVFRITGELVAELFNGVQTPGQYEVSFNPHTLGFDLASGIYLYSMQVESTDGAYSKVIAKKMMLLK